MKINQVLIYIAFFLISVSIPLDSHSADTDCFQKLRGKLIKAGFNKEQINEIYKNKGIYFDVKSVASYFQHNEGRLNYDQFKSPKLIETAKEYIKTHEAAFLRVEKTYGVNKEVITAIFLVETKLGTYTGKSIVFNTLSTMAALQYQDVRDFLWKKIPPKKRIPWKQFVLKAKKKSTWAYYELKAFLKYTEQQNIDPISLRGSYAGAIGIGQFIPSSILKYAKDGNADNKIDLFDNDDAIESTANYLKSFGWNQDLNTKDAFNVILNYNYSSYYVNTVLDIAGLITK